MGLSPRQIKPRANKSKNNYCRGLKPAANQAQSKKNQKTIIAMGLSPRQIKPRAKKSKNNYCLGLKPMANACLSG